MARRGFLSSVFNALRNVVSPVAREREAHRRAGRFARGQRMSAKDAERYARERRDAEITQRAQRQRRAQEKKRADPFRRSWEEKRQQSRKRPRGSLQKHARFFLSIPGLEYETDDDIQELWDSYLENMVFNLRGRRINRIDENPFWDEIGIAPEDFNWKKWRESMGFDKRKTP